MIFLKKPLFEVFSDDIQYFQETLKKEISNSFLPNELKGTLKNDRKRPVAAMYPFVPEEIFNPPADEVLFSHNSPPSLSLPEEIVIQSVPIKTAVTLNTSQTPQSNLKSTNNDGGINSYNVLNTLPIKILNPQHLNQHLFDGVATQTSEQDLVSFIQKLMDQAKKEQNDLELPDVSSFLPTKQADLVKSEKLNSSVSQDKNKDTSNQIMAKTKESLSSTASTSTKETSSTTTTAATSPVSRVTVPILPFRTTVRTTTELSTVTSTTDGSPSGVITRLLSEAAAPIAGLSAATLAYSAAAMLPVWLPAALAGRKKKSFEANLNLQDIQTSLEKNMFKQH